MVSLILSTFGFILSNILLAYVVGKIIEIKATRMSFMVASLIGMSINYVFGTTWMYVAYQLWFEAPPSFSYAMAWLWMLAPLPKDIIFAILGGGLAYRLRGNMYLSHLKKAEKKTLA